ncbi:hypothetical protein ACXX82_00165 [Glaciimonas sp. GNP009]
MNPTEPPHALFLPLLIIPPGGIKVVALPKLASHLWAPYESAWAWGAKLGAANALSCFEVSALLGVSAKTTFPLVPPDVPDAARLLGRKLLLPSRHIENAFFGGPLKFLQPLVCEQLRLCPVCARFGHHFILHQLRPFSCCPLHHMPLRERCPNCNSRLMYALGDSTVNGPISCPTCRAPQLPLTSGGVPKTRMISAQTTARIARWLTFLRRRCTDSDSFATVGMIDMNKSHFPAQPECFKVLKPSGLSINVILPSLRARWSTDTHYQLLEACYWTHSRRFWRKCHPQSRCWYQRLLRGETGQLAPTPRILAFLYWRMTWQGCTNPYLLRRSLGLPFYGIAEWEAAQPAPEIDDTDVSAFEDALEASWREWLVCIDLLGVEILERVPWRLRIRPAAYINLARKK